MNSRWIFAALLVALGIASVVLVSNPELTGRYAASVRAVNLSDGGKDLVMGALVVVIGGYLAWFLLARRG